MNAVSQLFAVLAALIYIVVFPMESFFLRHPAAQKFLSTPAQNVPAVMMWAIPTGFRNLLIGLGNIAGVVAVNTGYVVVGYTAWWSTAAPIWCSAAPPWGWRTGWATTPGRATASPAPSARPSLPLLRWSRCCSE